LNARQGRRLLIAAFAISLLIHLLWAFLVRRSLPPIETQVETVTIRHRLVMTKMATPPPLPKRTPVPHPVATSRPAPRATHATRTIGAQGGTGRATAAPTEAPTPAPAPTATANPCEKNDIEAVVQSTPAAPQIPVAARAEGTSGTALIDVKLDAAGTVTGATISQSSGNTSLDVVALGMARDSTYAPATHDCKPVASTYTFSVKFVAW
jgi:TonB family protein